MRFLLGVLFFLSLPVLGMQTPTRVYAAKTNELKELLNRHILSKPLPYVQIKQLVLDGADPNIKADTSEYYKGCSWFEALLLYGSICPHFWSTTQFLFEHGASPNMHSQGLLGAACHAFFLERIPHLIRWGADIHGLNWRGETPLFNTIYGHVVLMKYSMSSLPMRAVLVERLLELGAASDIEVANVEGETPLSLAQKNSLTPILQLFEKYKSIAP